MVGKGETNKLARVQESNLTCVWGKSIGYGQITFKNIIKSTLCNKIETINFVK